MNLGIFLLDDSNAPPLAQNGGSLPPLPLVDAPERINWWAGIV